MKFLRFDDNTTGLLVDHDSGPVVLDVAASLPAFAGTDAAAAQTLTALLGHDGRGSWTALIESWEQARGPFGALIAFAADASSGAVTKPLDSVRLCAPLASPVSRIFALGTNFAEHTAGAAASLGSVDPNADGVPEEERLVGGFFVIPGTVSGPDDEIAPPSFVQYLDYEVEATVVLGAAGRDLDRDSVNIWGVTVFNDFSIRDPHLGVGGGDRAQGFPYFLQKNFDGGNACGPYVVVDEGLDPQNLGVESRVNGQQRQNGTTAQMITSFAQRVEWISRFMTLNAGDMITSGTPAGTAIEQGVDGPYLKAGDVVEVEVEGVGVLRNTITRR